jgi:hypothetical protein
LPALLAGKGAYDKGKMLSNEILDEKLDIGWNIIL